jgi:peptidoglycan/LPS O-acetylase OafA/YrhL
MEGLRAIAAVAVLATHVWTKIGVDGQPFDIGAARYVTQALHHGVVLFFALSGFLLYLPFVAAALREQPRPAVRAYLRNRALRILPAYWFVLLCTGLLLQTASLPPAGAAVGALTDPVLLLENLTLTQNFDPDSVRTGIGGVVWSLAVELVFYIALPLLVLMATRLASPFSTRQRRRYAFLAPAALMALVGIVSTVLGPRGAYQNGWEHVWDLSIFPHAHLFALGLALAVARVEYEDGRLRLPHRWRTVTMVSAVVLGAATIKLGGDGHFPERMQVALVAVCCGMLLALVALPPAHRRSRLSRTLETRALLGTGLVSYSLFLWHVPVIGWAVRHDLVVYGGLMAFLVNLVVIGTLTGVLAWGTYRLIEKPALRHKASAHQRERTSAQT